MTDQKNQQQQSNIQLKEKLTDKQLSILRSEMEKRQKSTGVAYALAVLGGLFGVHKFYVKKPISGFFFLLPGILFFYFILSFFFEERVFVGIGSFSGALAILLGAVNLIRLTVDLFTIHNQVTEANEKVEREIIEQI